MNKKLLNIFKQRIKNHNFEKETFISPVFRPSLTIVKANADIVFDDKGFKYIDFTGGIAINALGHRNPVIINAIQDQIYKSIHTSNLFITPSQIKLATLLVKTANKAISSVQYASVFFSNSGSEANEAALKFGRLFAKRMYQSLTEKNELISFTNSSHGRTMGALSVTDKEKYKTPFAPLIPKVTILPLNNIDTLKNTVTSNTAAIIVEPIQGEGGLTQITKEFADEINRLAKEHNVIIIADEIQSGLYRTGTMFASTQMGLDPHIITIANSLGGGLPLGATITCKAIHDVLVLGDHDSTTGGNPVSCNTALAILKKLNSPIIHFQRHNTEFFLNTLIRRTVRKNINTSPLGAGCLRGIRLPTFIKAEDVITQAKKQGLLILKTGNNSIKIAPSLICDHAILKEGMQILDKSINDIRKAP